jgi:hypothetical protein
MEQPIKKEQPAALKAYQDFAKKFKDEYKKKNNTTKVPDRHIKDAYQVRKNHESYENFEKEYVIPGLLSEAEELQMKEAKKLKKAAKDEKKLKKAEKMIKA